MHQLKMSTPQCMTQEMETKRVTVESYRAHYILQDTDDDVYILRSRSEVSDGGVYNLTASVVYCRSGLGGR